MWNEILTIVGIPLVRGVSGWAINSLKDSKIDEIEWTRLVKTIIEIGTLSVFAYLALDKFGIDTNLMASTLGVSAADLVISWIKKKK